LPLSLGFGDIVGLLAKYRSRRHVRKLQARPIFTSMGKPINSHSVSATQAAADIQSAGAISRSDTDAIGMVLFP
jgi:hypothetical protein